jgi:hypothetical protein
MRARVLVLAAVLLAVLGPGAAWAQTLYAASSRNLAAEGPGSLAGSLHSVALATGTPTFIAPLRIAGSEPVALAGMAAHPASGAFYGITSTESARSPLSLVSFDPDTGQVRVIGALGQAASGIAFSRTGILYAWLNATGQLGFINLQTGAVTPIGVAGTGGPPAGLAIDSQGVALVTPAGASGSLDSVDLATGAIRRGPALTGAPFPAAINAMTFSPSGLLLAVNSNAGRPANTRLVAINVASGAIAAIGTLPDDTDGLAFANVRAPDDSLAFGMSGQTLALAGLGLVALVLGLIGWLGGRKSLGSDSK